MSYTVEAGLPVVNFAPETVVAEVLQNVAVILTTPRFSVPMDRGLGLNATVLDSPVPLAMARMQAEIITAVRAREPRANILEVEFTGDALQGILRPKVKVDING